MDKDYKLIMGDTTKTYSGERQIPIPQFIRDSLISQMLNKYKEAELEKLNDYYMNNEMFGNNDLKLLDNKETEEKEID